MQCNAAAVMQNNTTGCRQKKINETFKQKQNNLMFCVPAATSKS